MHPVVPGKEAFMSLRVNLTGKYLNMIMGLCILDQPVC